jgi:hypothetical protein
MSQHNQQHYRIAKNLKERKMDTATQERIVREETEKFLDPLFGGLDLSGSPNFNRAKTEQFAEQDEHGLSRVDTSGLGGVNHLKQLLSAPDKVALAELAKENPNFAEQWENDMAADIARQFVVANPKYLQTDRNFDRIVSSLLEKHFGQTLRNYSDADAAAVSLLSAGVWTLSELTQTFNHLYREGELETASNEPRYLSAAEKIRCEQIAASGQLLEAIIEYIKLSVGEDIADQVAFNMIDPTAFVSDPANRPIFEEACWFCWQAARPEFSPSAERIAAMKRHIAGRFVTVSLLDAAWDAVQKAEKDAFRSGLLNNAPEDSETGREPEPDFETLSDEEIARLRIATLREFAKQQRRRG